MNEFVLITGATSGIGKACAEVFAAKKWNLILTGRRQDRLDALQKELSEKYNVEVRSYCFDVRREEEVNRFAHELEETVKRNLRVVINNAGLAVGRGPINEGLVEDWERMIDTNVKGLLYVTRAISPILIENGSGHFINLSSIAGKEVYAGGNVYCATKHAVDALSKAMRIDLVSHGVKVTNIAPGAVETEFSLVRFKGDEKTAKSVYDGFQPLKAIDIANVIAFAAEQPAHVNLNDITIMPTAQASSSVTHKTSSVTKEA
jgi:3-hydroxy acid dehydrogenase / malonic semialdehyde reductase